MEATTTVVNLARALASVQGLLTNIAKDREVEVTGERARYKFKYATLAAIWNVARKPLADAGIAVVQLPTVDLQAKVVRVKTMLLYGATGEVLEGEVVLPVTRMDAQGIGATISYGRRYGLSAMLGIVSEDAPEELDELPPPPGMAPRPRSTPPPPAAPTMSEQEAQQMLDSCSSGDDLRKVAARIRGAGFVGEAKDRLLAAHAAARARIDGGGQ